MHELSIAMSMLDLAVEEARKRHATDVRAIHLRLGALSGVVREALENAYELALEGSPFEDCRLVIEEVPVLANCPTCGEVRPVVSIQQLCCQDCGTPTPDIVSGRDLEVFAMEIVE